MSSFYDGKVECPCCSEGKMLVHDEHYGYYEEQCWYCGASGWISKKALPELQKIKKALDASENVR